MKKKIGLLTFSDGRPRVHNELLPKINEHIDAIKKMFREKISDVELVISENIVTDPKIAVEESKKMIARDVDGTIFNFPVWNFPNSVSMAAQVGRPPYLFFAKRDPEQPGLVGMLCSKGGIEQLEIPYSSVWGDTEDDETVKVIDSFTRTAYVVNRLKGLVFGMIGGRSMGMYTAIPSLQQWMKQFAIDIEHIDQLEIVRIAETIDAEQVDRAYNWLKEKVNKIEFDQDTLTEENLKYQIRCYLATKKIVEENSLDFFGVKCHCEMSEHYVPQCLSAALFNDPYDWDGPKDPVVMACETDADGALTMQILKMLSDLPVLFMDFRDYDPEYNCFVFCNCGSQATWYAGCSDTPEDNLKNVILQPTIPMFRGGGCHVQYMAKPGVYTLARLGRKGDKYWMIIMKGEGIEVPREKMKESTWEWPHVFIKLDILPKDLIKTFPSNHAHAVLGDWVDTLVETCKYLGIEPVVMG